MLQGLEPLFSGARLEELGSSPEEERSLRRWYCGLKVLKGHKRKCQGVNASAGQIVAGQEVMGLNQRRVDVDITEDIDIRKM